MSVIPMITKPSPNSTAAVLRNLNILESSVRKVVERADHLPGLAVFSGPSGFGKSTAAGYIAGKYQSPYLEVRSTWTKKAFLEALLKQMGVASQRTVYQMMDQASEELACSQRPIILDEFDNAVDRNLVELVRDIYEQSKAPIILIGEERLPQKLQKWERFHGRIMDWSQAQPADIADAVALNAHYCPDITVRDCLLNILVEQARGSVRRIVTNLDQIDQFARAEGLKEVTAADWGQRPLHTSHAPAPRRF